MLMARKQAWLTVLLVTVVAIFGGFIVKIANLPKNQVELTPPPKKELLLQTSALYPQPRALASFSAQDQHGQPFANTQLQGKWTLMFFGYTSCPDICPTTLATMASVQKLLPANIAADSQFVFVSVDPERDSAAQLKDYLAFFSPTMMALHLEEPALQNFTRDLGVAYTKVPQAGSYVMDHSVRLFLINPRGERHALFSPTVGTQGFSVELVKNDLLAIVGH